MLAIKNLNTGALRLLLGPLATRWQWGVFQAGRLGWIAMTSAWPERHWWWLAEEGEIKAW
jgi:hypothetical protein